MIEVEIKARVKDINSLKESLNKIRASFTGSKRQIDKVFGNPSFLDENTKIIEGGLSARIRQVNDEIELTFKEIVRQGGGLEVEAKLSSIESGTKFLNKLNFIEAFTISKVRETYDYDNFEIAIDQVEQLGDFIEVERLVESEGEIIEARKECLDLLSRLMPGFEVINAKYGDLMQDVINTRRRS